MTLDQENPKHPANAAISGPYGHPFHPLLVTIPIGAWVSSLVFDIGSHVVNDPGYLNRGSVWLIAIGAIGAVLAAITGLTDLVRIPRHTKAFSIGLTHMMLNTLVLAAFIVNFFWRYKTFPDDGSVGSGKLILSIVSLAVLSMSGVLGAKLAFTFGVRVADEQTQSRGYTSAQRVPGTAPAP
jgi:uncharacterized membrane protein